ncbi:hypothetical protein DOY81_014713, partial [Sarcophaga bullata]
FLVFNLSSAITEVCTLSSARQQIREFSKYFYNSGPVILKGGQDFQSLINRRYFWIFSKKKMAPILAPTVKLNNGYEMPVLGLGTYELKKQKCDNAVREAINIGYRHIDTAYLYRM